MSTMRKGDSTLVYATDGAHLRPAAKPAAPAAGPIRVSRQSKGRGGKTVTLVTGLPLNDAELAALAKRLRSACGAGGTVKDGVVEVQGEHRDRVVAWLQAEGYAAKSAGG